MAGKTGTTGSKAASAAGKTLSNPNAGKAEKSAAASALTQVKNAAETTHKAAASAAGKTLHDPHASAAAKSAAGSALSQAAKDRK